MNTEIIAANLKRIRVAKGLSQRAVAEAAVISPATYKKIESAAVEPRVSTLEAVARALNARIQDLVTPVRSLTHVRFRAGKRMVTRENILAEVAKWLDDYTYLEQILDDQIPYRFAPVVSSLRKTTAQNRAVLAAEKARKVLDLDATESIRDICGLLESAGVKVYPLTLNSDSFFGLSVAREDKGPAVVVNVWERIAVERRIFSAAHELGHLLLHLDAFDVTKTEEDQAQEAEASRFASHFLMPQPAFERAWNDAYGLHPVQRVLKVKRIFHVSYKTVLWRLIEMGAVSGDVWRKFNTEYGRLYGRSLGFKEEPTFSESLRAHEPEELAPSDFLDNRFSRLVQKALDLELISLSRAAEIMGIDVSQIRQRAAEWMLA